MKFASSHLAYHATKAVSSHLLSKKGISPHIKNLVGKLEFTDEVLDATAEGLENSAVPMPTFGNIESTLAAELDDASPEDQRKLFLEEHLKQIIKAQALTRMFLARRKYNEKLNRLKSAEELFVKVSYSNWQ